MTNKCTTIPELEKGSLYRNGKRIYDIEYRITERAHIPGKNKILACDGSISGLSEGEIWLLVGEPLVLETAGHRFVDILIRDDQGSFKCTGPYRDHDTAN